MKLFQNIFLGKAIQVVPLFTNIYYYLECEDYNVIAHKKESWNLYYGTMKNIKKAIPALIKLRPNIKIQIKTYRI